MGSPNPMAAAVKRQSPPTHPTVWAGLGLAAVGLLVAAYAYTGTRVYDITFAFVAVVGGLLALAGILTAAWGRAVMSARAQRSRRGLLKEDAATAAREARAEEERPPTVAAPASKRSFDFAGAARRLLPRPAPREEKAADRKALFAFRSPAAPAPAPAPEPAAAAPAAEVKRVKVRCPQCSTQFAGEGVRPFTLTCPSCGFAAEV